MKTIEDSPQLVARPEVSMTDEYAAELENIQLIKAIEASLEVVYLFLLKVIFLCPPKLI